MKNSTETRISELSGHLQANVLTLRGKALGTIPTLRASHLLPLALLAGMSAAVVAFPKVRNSVVIRLAMVASSHLVPTPRSPGERPGS